MRILIVDDQYDEKIQAISAVIKNRPEMVVEYETFTDLAVAKMQSIKYDLLIIDLQLAEAFGQPIKTDGGRCLVEFILHDDQSNRPNMIVGITSHQSAYDESLDFFTRHGYSLHLYNGEPDFIKEILDSQTVKEDDSVKNVDVLIVNALEGNELQEVLRLCDDYSRFYLPDDPTPYYKFRVSYADDKIISGIAVALPTMGMASASALTMKASLLFNPKLIAMTGICAAANDKLNFGDIVVAKFCWDWGSGKLSLEGGSQRFFQAPDQIPIYPSLSSYFESISVGRNYLDEIYAKYKGKKPTHVLNLHVGPVCSGAAVLEDPAIVRRIVEQGHRKTLGIDMEAYGFMFAVRMCSNNPPPYLVIKSISDYADPEKSDDWQDYASYTSAAILFRYLEEHKSMFL